MAWSALLVSAEPGMSVLAGWFCYRGYQHHPSHRDSWPFGESLPLELAA